MPRFVHDACLWRELPYPRQVTFFMAHIVRVPGVVAQRLRARQSLRVARRSFR
jgi:hypothetical protein